MNTMELLGYNGDGSDRKEPVEIIIALVEQMHTTAQAEQKTALIRCESQHEIGYRKGKVQALHEVLEMLRTGETPSAANEKDEL